MDTKYRISYEAPTTDVLFICTESGLLQGSITTNSMKIGDYDEEVI